MKPAVGVVAGWLTGMAVSKKPATFESLAEPFDAIELSVGLLFGDEDD